MKNTDWKLRESRNEKIGQIKDLITVLLKLDLVPLQPVKGPISSIWEGYVVRGMLDIKKIKVEQSEGKFKVYADGTYRGQVEYQSSASRDMVSRFFELLVPKNTNDKKTTFSARSI